VAKLGLAWNEARQMPLATLWLLARQQLRASGVEIGFTLEEAEMEW